MKLRGTVGTQANLPPVESFGVVGFDERFYNVSLVAGSLVLAVEQTSAELPDVTNDQRIVIGFLKDHIGELFRAGAVATQFDTNGVQRYKTAALDGKTGLFPFVERFAGPDNLWFRNRKDNQFGKAPDEPNPQPEAQPDSIDTDAEPLAEASDPELTAVAPAAATNTQTPKTARVRRRGGEAVTAVQRPARRPVATERATNPQDWRITESGTIYIRHQRFPMTPTTRLLLKALVSFQNEGPALTVHLARRMGELKNDAVLPSHQWIDNALETINHFAPVTVIRTMDGIGIREPSTTTYSFNQQGTYDALAAVFSGHHRLSRLHYSVFSEFLENPANVQALYQRLHPRKPR